MPACIEALECSDGMSPIAENNGDDGKGPCI